jgi:hypothetical protein
MEMAALTRNFYDTLYMYEGVANIQEVIDVVPVKVTSEMNVGMLKPFEGKEVKEVLFQMFPTKAPGPDGYPGGTLLSNTLGGLWGGSHLVGYSSSPRGRWHEGD